MLEQISAPNHVVAIKLNGKLTGEGIREYQGILETKLNENDQIGLFVDLSGLEDLSEQGLVEGTKADMELLTHISQVRRCAFLSDKEWPGVVAGFAKQALPTLDIKVFPISQADKALAWSGELEATPSAEGAAIRFLKTDKESVLAFEIDGVMTSEEMPGIIKKMEEYFANHDKVRLLNRMKHFGGFEPSILMQSGLMSMKLSGMDKVERYAIVGAPRWMAKVIGALNPAFSDIDIRTFTTSQEDEAWKWLNATPVE